MRAHTTSAEAVGTETVSRVVVVVVAGGAAAAAAAVATAADFAGAVTADVDADFASERLPPDLTSAATAAGADFEAGAKGNGRGRATATMPAARPAATNWASPSGASTGMGP